MEFAYYYDQLKHWPQQGKHILAQYNDNSVIVYQAYRPSIGLYAAKHQCFGGEFSFSRMSWIKTSFLWMMYRSAWGTKAGQEITLAVTLKKSYFENILRNAFPSTNTMCIDKETWKEKVARSDVRLQWDPDHRPDGSPEQRRAIQLGLRNEFLAPFSGEGIISIDNISSVVEEQREYVYANNLDKLLLPEERVYEVDTAIRQILGM